MSKLPKRFPVTPQYLKARGISINAPYDRFSKFLQNEDDVFAVAVDMPVSSSKNGAEGPGNVLATAVAYANGAANIYFNNGVDYTGAASKYVAVVKAGQMLVFQAGRVLDRAEKAETLDLPTELCYNCFFVTKNGTFHYVYRPNELPEDDKEGRLFHYCVTNLMKELHQAQLKDGIAKTVNGGRK